MNDGKTWLLIADASKARIFSLHKARLFNDPDIRNLELIGEFKHPESRKKDSELVTDRMGEFGSGTFEPNTDPHRHEAEVFAQELLKHLENGHRENHYRDIILVAPSHFMGLLDKHMHHGMQKLVAQKIEKDYTQYDGKTLMQNLLAHF